MEITIFRNNTPLIGVKPLESSQLRQKKQTEDVIYLSFQLPNYIILNIGDYIIYSLNSQKYTLNNLPRVVESPMNYLYECTFEGSIHELQKLKLFFKTASIDKTYKDYRFDLTGNASTFLNFIVSVINESGYNYSVGAAKETEMMTMAFDNYSVYEAITQLSEALQFDWYLKDNTLHFDSSTPGTTYVMQTGRLNGFTQLTRNLVTSEKLITRLYGYGSTENLPLRTGVTPVYDSELLHENRLCFSGINGFSYLEKNVDKYGLIEDVQEFDIKPEFTGQITMVSSNLNEFVDTSIPFNINDYLAPGITPKITFLTGKLMGLTFNISFQNKTSTIFMDTYTDESGDYPNSLIYCQVGDTYKIHDIMFPEVYIEQAQTRLRQATQDYLDKHCEPACIYEGVVDETLLELNNWILFVGDYLRVISGVFQIDKQYEIIEIQQNIINPFQVNLKFGDAIPKNLLNLLANMKFTTDKKIYNLTKTNITNNEINNILGETLTWQQIK